MKPKDKSLFTRLSADAIRLHSRRVLLSKDFRSLCNRPWMIEHNPKIVVSAKLQTMRFEGKLPAPRVMSIFYLMLGAIDWSQFKNATADAYHERRFTIPLGLIKRHIGEVNTCRVLGYLEQMNDTMISYRFGPVKGIKARQSQPLMQTYVDGKTVYFAPGARFLFEFAQSRKWNKIEYAAFSSFRSAYTPVIYPWLAQAASFTYTDRLTVSFEELKSVFGYTGALNQEDISKRFVAPVLKDMELSQSVKIDGVEFTEDALVFVMKDYAKGVHECGRKHVSSKDIGAIREVSSTVPTPSIPMLAKAAAYAKTTAYEVAKRWHGFVRHNDVAASNIKKHGVVDAFFSWAKGMKAFDAVNKVSDKLTRMIDCLDLGTLIGFKYALSAKHNPDFEKLMSKLDGLVDREDVIAKFSSISSSGEIGLMRRFVEKVRDAYEEDDVVSIMAWSS